MSTSTTQKQDPITIAFNDFLLSRQSIRVSKRTYGWYQDTLSKFITYLTESQVTDLTQINARVIRAYLAALTERNLSDSYIHSHARVIKTFVRFLFQEEYIDKPVTFQMPRIRQKRLPVLSAQQIAALLKVTTVRETTIIMFLVDTGVRISEFIKITWDDIDLNSGKIRIRAGKGGKDRTVIISHQTARQLVTYRRTLTNANTNATIMQSKQGLPLTRWGMAGVIHHLSERTGIPFSAHALRRSFCILALRAGMSPLAVQDLMGHSDLTMTKHYAQMIDDDLLQAHHDHSPIDNLKDLI